MMLQRTAVRFSVGIVVLLLVLDVRVLQCAAPGYKVINVQKGGSVHGTVQLSGTVTDQTVSTGKDEKICGRAAPLSRVSTGRNGGVNNAIVYIEKIEEGKQFASRKKYLLDQKACQYVPHVLVLPFGMPLEIVNSDQVLHNVHISELGPGRASVVNIAQPIKDQRTVIQASRLKKPGFLVATCDAGHPWMNAYVMVAVNPYYTLTDADGKYVIDDIPPGNYKLVMWHEGVRVTKVDTQKGKTVRYEYEAPYVTESQITVEKGQAAKVDFSLQLR